MKNKENQNNQNDLNNSDLAITNKNKFSALSISSRPKVLPVLDYILEEVGYGKHQIFTFILTGLIISLQGFYFSYASSLFLPLQKYLRIGDNQMSLLCSVVYAGGVITSVFLGMITHSIGRKNLNVLTLVIIIISHILLAAFPTFYCITGCLFINGAAVGLNGVLVTNILAEKIPIRLRAFVLCSAWTWYSLANVFILVVYLIYMPDYNEDKFLNLQWIYIILPIVTSLMSLLFLRDSPRDMILNHKIDEAMEYLESMTGRKITEVERRIMIDEVCSRDNTAFKPTLRELFDYKVAPVTILLSILWISTNMAFYGPYVILAKTLHSLSIENPGGSTKDIIKNQIIISLCNLSSNLIAGALSEMKMVGRKLGGFIGSILACAFAILIVVNSDNFVLYISLFNIVTNVGVIIIIAYTAEIYPTILRDYAGGFLNSLGYAGSMISQPIYIGLSKYGVLTPYVFTGLICIVCGIVFLLLPLETYGIALDRKLTRKTLLDDDENND